MDAAALAELNENVRAGRVRLFHGGCPGLEPGSFVLPPSVTGAASMRGESEQLGFTKITTRADLVYVTSERRLATAIAAAWGKRPPQRSRGWVYRVELDDEDVQLDTDAPRGPFFSFQLRKVRVAAVLDRGVDPNDPKHTRVLESFVAQLK